MPKYTRVVNGKDVTYRTFELFLIDILLASKVGINYGKEIKAAKVLTSLTKNQDFWEQVCLPKVPSLVYFIKPENMAIIEYQFEEFKKKRWLNSIKSRKNFLDFSSRQYTLEEDKVSENVEINKPILSIKDFLKYGQNSKK